jgi:protein-disulfide isomerase
MSSRLDRLVTLAMASSALVVAALAIRRELWPPKPESVAQHRDIPDWRSYASSTKWIGSPSAPNVVTVFSDFECPYCAEAAVRIDSLVARGDGRVAVAFRHLPIGRLHPNARRTAMAAECAAEQGRFREFHALAFAKQDSLGVLLPDDLARAAGVADLSTFRTCMQSDSTNARVYSDSVDASRLRIAATPSVLVDGRLYTGMPPVEVLDRVAGTAQR